MQFNLIAVFRKYWVLVLIVALVFIVVFIVYNKYIKDYKRDTHITIILSPHFDDAVLSLGGLLAKKEHPVIVATFFTAKPKQATTTDWDKNSGFKNSDEAEPIRVSENVNALKDFNVVIQNYDYPDFQYGRKESVNVMRVEIAKDIQALIASYNNNENKIVDVYAPAIFNKDINHRDHELLHQAFLDVSRNYPDLNVHFFMYEDFPYVQRFNETAFVSLQKNLENDSGLLFNKKTISLTVGNVVSKINSLKKYSSQVKAFDFLDVDITRKVKEYTETRCGTGQRSACEVVYEIVMY